MPGECPNLETLEQSSASWAGKIAPMLITSTINASKGSPINLFEGRLPKVDNLSQQEYNAHKIHYLLQIVTHKPKFTGGHGLFE